MTSKYVCYVGELVVGTSDVCGTGWYGAVVHYRSFEQAGLSLSNYASYHLTESTTGNGVFVNDTHVTFKKCL